LPRKIPPRGTKYWEAPWTSDKPAQWTRCINSFMVARGDETEKTRRDESILDVYVWRDFVFMPTRWPAQKTFVIVLFKTEVETGIVWVVLTLMLCYS
jgi:hypothetical protein